MQVTGDFASVEAIAATPIVANGKSVRLDAIARVERKPVDPATFRMRFGAKDAVGVGISLRSDGDVARLGEDLKRTIAALQSEMPVGVGIHTVSDQTHVVDDPSANSRHR
jgi:multidrug efflux pump